MAPQRPVVWGIGTARTIRAHWVLCELGLDYETREIIPRTESMQDAAFTALSRRGKVPILQDGELVIGESAAIVSYLADRHRDRTSLAPPPATPERARFDELCFFIMVELDAILYVIRRHEGLPEIYGEAPVATAAARQYFLRQAGDLERSLADGRPHLLGEAFSSADILLMSCLQWAAFVDIPLSERLEQYSHRLKQRPAYRQAITNNFPPAAIAALQRTNAPA